MGLAHRVIPTLLVRGDQLVKGKRFDSWRSVGHVVQAAKIYAHRAADEIILLDIAATPEGRGPNLALIEKIAKDFYTPLTVGGGVRSVQDVRDLLNAGADKVSVGSAFVNLSEMRVISESFGKQALVASIDVRDGEVAWQCGTQMVAPRMDPVKYAELCAKFAGEILLTSIDREGTMDGYDLELIRVVSTAVDVPVIAHGGCWGYQDMADAIHAGASAVAAGALFQFSDCTPKEAARYLASAGIEARV